jgi:hypothetical protein
MNNKKTLVFTVSDLRETSIGCINLLYESLLKKNSRDDFDFAVVTNIDNNVVPNLNRDFIFINQPMSYSYIGWLKFTNQLPNGYDYYLYLDSDILCFESLEYIKGDAEITVVYEEIPMTNEWFWFNDATDEEKELMLNHKGINAGTFGFRNMDFMNKLSETMSKYNFSQTPTLEQAKFEQTILNYVMFNQLQHNKPKDITEKVLLHAKEELNSHTIYHFCGFDGHMDKKFSRMKIVTDKFNISNQQ